MPALFINGEKEKKRERERGRKKLEMRYPQSSPATQDLYPTHTGARSTTEMKHFSHDHPLVGLGFTAKQDEGTVICAGCRLNIDGPALGCKECEFYLHEHCAGLHPELRHPLHPDGPLQLKLCKPYTRMWDLYMCKICLDYITQPRFVYECNRKCSSDECKRRGFIIHVDCAFLQPSLSNNNHKGHLLV
ncbi:hypothetical protein Ancab_021737, partial [Ancistrocladus abbreviatus]